MISNTGEAVANNVYVGIYINGSILGVMNLGNLLDSYDYTVSFDINGLPEGEHIITIEADYYNYVIESNENNNKRSTTFRWMGKPDLIAEIYNILNTSEVDANTYVDYRFTITNIGNGVAEGPFKVALVLSNGIETDTTIYQVDYLAPGYKADLDFSVNFGFGSLGTVKVIADSTNSVAESNEYNNSAEHICKLKYCLHNMGSYTSDWAHTIYAHHGDGTPSKTSPTVQVFSSASSVYSISELNSIQDWNNISSNVTIGAPIYSDVGTANVRISAGTLSPGVLGRTNVTRDNFTWTSIILTNIPSQSSELRKRTITHEMGHALGLAHPHEEGDTCSYPGIMWQSNFISSGFATYDITNADKYNIQHLYGE